MRDRDAAFADFFAAEAERLRRLAFFMTGDLEGAADLAQDALSEVYARWNRIDSPSAYARRALVNRCLSLRRRRTLERKIAGAGSADVVSDDGCVEEAIRVADALQILSARQRAVVILRFYEDRTEPQIAHMLARPVGTVKSDLHRALAKLRPVLDETPEEVS